MKKLIVLTVALLALALVGVAVAEQPDAAEGRVLREGKYIIGQDIQAGTYTLTCTGTAGEQMNDAYDSLGHAIDALDGGNEFGSLFGMLGGMAENYVETMVAALEKSGADLGIAGYTRIKNGERSQQKVKNHTYPLADGTFVADFFQLYNAWLLHMPGNKIYKRELIGALTFPLDKSLGEDLLFNLAYMEQCKKIQTVDSCGYQYVIAMAGSLATTFREDKMENSLDLHRSVWQFAENMFGRQKVAQQGDSRLMKELHAYLRQLLLTDGKTWNEKKKIMKHYFSHPVIRENYKNLSKKNGADGMLAKFCIKKQFIPYCTLLVIGAWAKKQVQRKMWIKQMVFK